MTGLASEARTTVPRDRGRGRAPLSIRTRLTLAIALLTAVVSALAVFGGMRAMTAQVRSDAVDGRIDELSQAAEAAVLFEDQLEELDEDDLIEIFGDEIDLDDLEDLEDLIQAEAAVDRGLARDAQVLLIDLATLGLDDQLFDWFGDDENNLHLLLFDGSVAVIPRSLTTVETITIDEADDIVLPIADLEELWAVSFEQFDEDQTVAERDLDAVTVDVDDIEIGLLVDVTDELSALAALRTPLWAAAAALTILAAVATWFLTGRALRPVAAITDQVAEITSGKLDGRVPEPGTGDEIGVLARTMNRMLERLERSDRQRRQFVSDASHELRTPLAVLRSEAEVARRAPDTTTVADFGRVVIGETNRLETLVEDLLSLARADERKLAGARTAAPVELDVDDVVLNEAERTRRLPIDRSQVSAGRVIGRPDDLARAVSHLLDNAARHGEMQVAVGVRTEPGADGSTSQVRIWVDDDGAGIPDEDRERIFDRFHRLDEARTRDRGGSGLGLAVVAETAAAMGGTVRAETSPTGGARIELVLPAAV
jgi:signal transduction histidine kinase